MHTSLRGKGPKPCFWLCFCPLPPYPQLSPKNTMPIPVWPCGDDYKKERKCRLEHQCPEKGRKCAGIVCSAWAYAETAAQVCERASPGRLSLWHIHGYDAGGTSGQEGKRRRRFPLILPILAAACSASQDPCALRHQVRKCGQCGAPAAGGLLSERPPAPRGGRPRWLLARASSGAPGPSSVWAVLSSFPVTWPRATSIHWTVAKRALGCVAFTVS